MAETSASDGGALAARLVTARLTAPGIIDRGAVQRTVDRLSRTASAHALDRLQRGAAPTSVGGEPLMLVRADRGDTAAGTSGAPVPGASTPVSAEVPATSASAPGAPVARILARQTLGTGRAAERVASRLTQAPASGGGSQLVARLAARGDASVSRSPGPADASGPVLQRNVPTPPISAATPRGEVTGTFVPAESAAAARVDSPRAASSPVIRRRSESPVHGIGGAPPSIAREPRSVTAEPVASASPTSAGISASPPSLPRAAASEPRAAAAAPATAARSASSGAGPSAPLLLRTPERARAARPPAPTPTIASRTAGVVARAEASPVAAPAPKPASEAAAYAWTPSGPLDMDWIVEQVGSRLARRLEVERERQGIREWRQQS